MYGPSSKGLESERNTSSAKQWLREEGLKFLFNVSTNYSLYDFNPEVDSDLTVARAQDFNNARLVDVMCSQYGNDAIILGESYPPGIPHAKGVYVKTEAYIAAHSLHRVESEV